MVFGRTTIWAACLWYSLSAVGISQSEIERLDDLDPVEAKNRLATRLLEGVSNHDGKTFTFVIHGAGVQRSDEGKLVSCKQRLRLVTAKKLGFSEVSQGAAKEVVTARTADSMRYLFDGGRIIHVTRSCDGAMSLPPLIPFCQTTNASSWIDDRGNAVCLNRVIQKLHELDWLGVQEEVGGTKVLVLGKTEYPKVGQTLDQRRQLYYFAEQGNHLVWRGFDYIPQGQTSHEVHGKCVARDVVSIRVDYQMQEEWLVPRRVTDRASLEVLGLDLEPLQNPLVLRDITYQVRRVTVDDTFPDKVLDIPVPENATFRDGCVEQEQVSMSKSLERGSSWPRQWLVLAGGFCLFLATIFWIRNRG